MGIVKGRLKVALLTSLLFGPATAQALEPDPAAPVKAHRSLWDLGSYATVRLGPLEKGAAINAHPAQVSAASLTRRLGPIHALTQDGDEALFATAELVGLARAMSEALSLAGPREDVLLFSGNKRGAGFFASPVAVMARLFVKDGSLNLIVQDARLEVLGQVNPSSDWPHFQHGSRTLASHAELHCPGARSPRPDWLILALDPVEPEVAVTVPPPVASAPATAAAPARVPVDQADRLRTLNRLRDEKLLTEQEYQRKREEILRSL